MTSSYEEIFSRFYLRVKDYEIISLDEKIANEMLKGYLRQVVSKPMVRRLFSSVMMDDDIEEIDYTLRQPLDDESDKDFVEEMLSLGMVERWVDPRFHSTLLTSQFFSNSEQRFFAQSTQLNELRAMYSKAQTDFRKLIRDRGYSISVINGVESS